MDTRYINAEHKLAIALTWTGTDYSGLDGTRSGRAQGVAPGSTERTHIPAWARCSEDCLKLMLAHRCFVAAEVTSEGADVMVARWTAADGFGERIAVPLAEHKDDAAAFRYAAVLGVTAKVEAEHAARELTDMVSA
ncbi:hypothetical protein ACFPOU_08410 [Massilia jejuensis]|uniref:Uncharacterized protein n=1 Tax=Massilia jejuensis TaxID=648894 RepID=A0ABW0PKS8_9BURK